MDIFERAFQLTVFTANEETLDTFFTANPCHWNARIILKKPFIKLMEAFKQID